MRDFEEYTTDPRPVYRRRRRRRFAVLATIAAVLLGLGAWASAMPPQDDLIVSGDPREYAGESSPEEPSEAAAGEPERTGSAERASEEQLNVLILGLDQREEEEGDEEGVRTDTIMVAQLDEASGDLRLLSIPRDLYVEVEPGEGDRINSAYTRGGVSQTVEVVEDLTNLDIDHHAIVDFQGFEEIVDAMGGVEVELQEGQYPPGWQVEGNSKELDGQQALMYTRFRDAPGGDLGRIERQQQVLTALRQEALQWDSLRKLPEISRVADENVETDLSFGEMVALGHALMRQGEEDRMETVQLRGEPFILSDGREVLIPDREANEEILYEFY